MATRSPKKQASSAPHKERAKSPLSPTRISRLQEQLELRNLNDRLAAYIDRVRTLENENSRLMTQIKTVHETSSREVRNVKTLYDAQLSETRKLLDNTAKEKAELMIDCGNIKSECEELRAKLSKLEKTGNANEIRLADLERLLLDVQSRCTQSLNEKNKALDELAELKKQNDKLKKQLEECQRQQQSEVLSRIELENSILSLKEELDLKEQVFEQQLTEVHTEKQVEVSEIDGRLQKEYENRLQEAVKELRDSYDLQMSDSREQIETLYQRKITYLNNQLRSQTDGSASIIDELHQCHSKISDLQTAVSELQGKNATLNDRLKELERVLEHERVSHADLLSHKNMELQQLRDEISQALKDFQDLLDIKTSLDAEIAMYRKLLEGEEYRLNLSSESDVVTPRRTPLRGKRRRFLETSTEKDMHSISTAKGPVKFVEEDKDGHFIKLLNTGDADVSLGGWQLARRANSEEIVHKFHAKMVLHGGASVTVWSSDANQTHNPPENLVMKTQKWPVGDAIVTVLLNGDGEEMARKESTRKETRVGGGFYRKRLAAGEEYQEIDENNAADRCNLM